ncbi:MAG: Gfo/Idh/MocA family oxidoreductase [Dehalococcoidales bacterium]|nr:Gfo/Idh/MocA family oxidoreductase [Dehalococcoidales bacterium]
MLRVGVVGVGAMGENHARLYSGMNCELVGVVDTDNEQGEQIARKYYTEYYKDYHDLIPKVDAVSIVVPTIKHHEIGMEFLAKGIHCLIEKPISTDLATADEMIKTAEASNTVLAVGHIENHNPAVRKLKQIVDDRVLGDILMLSAKRVGPFVPRIRDVGIIVDTATHDIGVINLITGKIPNDVFSKVGKLRHEISDHGVMVLDYNGVFASIEVNWFTPHKVRTLVVTGSEGIAYLDYIEQNIVVHNSHDIYDIEVKKAEPLKLELQDFLDAIEEGRKPMVNGVQARDILEVALKVTNGHNHSH